MHNIRHMAWILTYHNESCYFFWYLIQAVKGLLSIRHWTPGFRHDPICFFLVVSKELILGDWHTTEEPTDELTVFWEPLWSLTSSFHRFLLWAFGLLSCFMASSFWFQWRTTLSNGKKMVLIYAVLDGLFQGMFRLNWYKISCMMPVLRVLVFLFGCSVLISLNPLSLDEHGVWSPQTEQPWFGMEFEVPMKTQMNIEVSRLWVTKRIRVAVALSGSLNPARWFCPTNHDLSLENSIWWLDRLDNFRTTSFFYRGSFFLGSSL